MNAKIGILIAVILVVLLGFAGFMYVKGARNKAAKTTNTQVMIPKPTQSSGVFNTISDIFTNKTLSLMCSFTDSMGRKTTSYIKNGSMRADVTGTTPATSTSVIIKNNTMYSWNGARGMMLKFSPEQMAQAVNGGNANAQAALQDVEKYKESCRPGVVADSLFTPPANVTFQDVSSMMKGIPTGAAANGAGVPSINPSNYQQMMQKYQNP